jgi:hypothetical protein
MYSGPRSTTDPRWSHANSKSRRMRKCSAGSDVTETRASRCSAQQARESIRVGPFRRKVALDSASNESRK